MIASEPPDVFDIVLLLIVGYSLANFVRGLSYFFERSLLLLDFLTVALFLALEHLVEDFHQDATVEIFS